MSEDDLLPRGDLPAGGRWPLDASEHLLAALAEQGIAPDEAHELAPSLMRLSAWRAPASTAGERDRLIAKLDQRLHATASTPFTRFQLGAYAHARAQGMRAQVRLLRPAVWIASAAGILLAVLYALVLPRQTGEHGVLVFALPLVAGVGGAFLYGPEVDAGLELALATPTSPRTVLAARFALLFAFDAALALLGTLLVAGVHGESFWALTSLWLAPMTFLSALSLALSLVLGPAAAAGAALVLSLSRILRFGGGVTLQPPSGGYWQASPLLLIVAAMLVLVALYLVPRITDLPQQER